MFGKKSCVAVLCLVLTGCDGGHTPGSASAYMRDTIFRLFEGQRDMTFYYVGNPLFRQEIVDFVEGASGTLVRDRRQAEFLIKVSSYDYPGNPKACDPDVLLLEVKDNLIFDRSIDTVVMSGRWLFAPCEELHATRIRGAISTLEVNRNF